MKMKKGTFAIHCVRDGEVKIDVVNGYILDYGCFRFGIRKVGMQWSITDISTGMLTGLYADRKKDIIPLLETRPELLENLKRCLDNPDKRILAAQEKIREFYTL